MRNSSIILFFLLGFLVQTSFINLFSIAGINANLLLCLTIVLIPISEQPIVTLTVAAITGLVYDICFAQFIGITSIGLAIIGFALFYFSNILNIGNIKFILLITVISTIFFNLIIWVFYKILQEPYNFIHVLSLQPFYILYNLIAVGLIYYFLMKAGERNE